MCRIPTRTSCPAVAIIETATNTVVATVLVDIGPLDVAVHPSGQRVYVSNVLPPGSVSVIGANTDTVVATMTRTACGGFGCVSTMLPHGVAIGPESTGGWLTLNQSTARPPRFGPAPRPVDISATPPEHQAVGPGGTRRTLAPSRPSVPELPIPRRRL